MQNGNPLNGAHGQPTIQVNPQQAAAFALQFLEAVPHTRAQREFYDHALMMLNAIATGQATVVVTQASSQHAPVPDLPETEPVPKPPTPVHPGPVPAPPAPAPAPPGPVPPPAKAAMQ